MFTSYALTALLALATSNLVAADVTPSEPGPGDVFNAGSQTRIVWGGDTDSTTDWKNMAIELMSGSNFGMVHITTVATGQDGTTAGSFTYTCPDVSPNSPIYFYQFSAPNAANKTWTTRFTIASATGQTTPAANDIQPNTGDHIPWGMGALTDPSKAVPPPSFVGDAGAGAGNSSAISTSLPPSTISSSPSVSSTDSSASSSTSSSSARLNNVASSPGIVTSASSASTAKETNAARGTIVTDRLLWQSLMVLGASAMTFTVLL